MRYCRTNSHRPLTNAYSAERFGTAYRTNGSLTLPDGCACGHSRRLWPRGLQADGTDHGAHRQERRVVRAVADHRTGHIWNFLNEARDPGQIKPSTLVAAGDEETTAVCQVAGLASAGDGTIVHLKLLPGLADGYRQLVE